jgi:hypothetical protein
MTRRRELILVAVVALLAVATGYLLLVRPVLGRTAAARADEQRAASQSQVLRSQIGALQDVKANAVPLQARAKAARGMFPPRPALPDLVDALQKVADQSGVELVSVQPAAPALSTANPALAEITTGVVVTGGYFQVEDFLARLEGLVKGSGAGPGIPPRSVLVRSVSLSSTGSGAAGAGAASQPPATSGTDSDQLTGNISLVAFQAVTSPATPAAATSAPTSTPPSTVAAGQAPRPSGPAPAGGAQRR